MEKRGSQTLQTRNTIDIAACCSMVHRLQRQWQTMQNNVRHQGMAQKAKRTENKSASFTKTKTRALFEFQTADHAM